MNPSGAARLAGVMGWPVKHSRSPRLHGYWLDRHGIDGAYVPLPVRPEDLAGAFAILPRVGFAGWNLTVPHKERALALVDDVEPLARRIGAVNTVVVGADGQLTGRNTDAGGFIESLKAGAPGWRADAAPAVVVGAGGAARACVVGLLDAGAPAVRVVNRTGERAEAMAADLGGRVATVAWAERADALAGAGLLANTTTLGMQGEPPLDLPLDALPAAALVTDAVYVPLETPLLPAARARGNRPVDGLGLLLHQARPGCPAWFGIGAQVTAALRAAVLGGG